MLKTYDFLYRIVEIEAACLQLKADVALHRGDQLKQLQKLSELVGDLCVEVISGDETKLFLADGK